MEINEFKLREWPVDQFRRQEVRIPELKAQPEENNQEQKNTQRNEQVLIQAVTPAATVALARSRR